VVEYRPSDPGDELALEQLLPRIAAEGAPSAARVQTLVPEQAHDPLHLRRKLRLATHLDQQDAEELRGRVDDLLAFVRLLEAKYVGDDALDAVHCNYSIDVAVHAIEASQPAAPMVTCRPLGNSTAGDHPPAGAGVGVLSPREREVAVGIVNGRSRTDIADRLGITVSTVATLTKRLYRKLGVHSKSQLTHRLVGQRATA
jgi:DNA-binding CsgD family transcriptional regulator